jgi:hypothetical protein
MAFFELIRGNHHIEEDCFTRLRFQRKLPSDVIKHPPPPLPLPASASAASFGVSAGLSEA